MTDHSDKPVEPSSLPPLQTMTFAPTSLDEETRAYLINVWRDRGVNKAGVFINRSRFNTFWLLVGLALMAAGVWLWLPSEMFPGTSTLPWIRWTRVGFLVVGGVMAAANAHTLWRKWRTGFGGSFLFADAAFIWNVSPHGIEATPIHTVQGALGKRRGDKDGHYTHTDVVVVCPEGQKHLKLTNSGGASELVRFLSHCGHLTYEATDDESVEWKSSPTLRSARARRMLEEDKVRPRPLDLDDARPIPTPSGAPINSWPRSAVLGLAGASCLALAFTVLPALNLMLADDGHWERAREKATFNSSPAALRDYLSNTEYIRHRHEAQELINKFYDQAITGLKRLAKDAPPTELPDGLITLLDTLKRRERPIVTIGFKPRIDEFPTTNEQKLLGEEDMAEYRRVFGPELKDLEDKDGSAIIPLGEVFSHHQVELREEIIRKRVAGALGKILSSDIFKLELAAAGAEPDIVIDYHTYATGGLYTIRTQKQPVAALRPDEGRLDGLLRSYRIHWTLSIQPVGSGKSFEHGFVSNPGSKLNLRPGPGDPRWAPYAVLMYSAFHDFSNERIKGFGLPAPPVPDSFSFRDATGSHQPPPRDELLDELFKNGLPKGIR